MLLDGCTISTGFTPAPILWVPGLSSLGQPGQSLITSNWIWVLYCRRQPWWRHRPPPLPPWDPSVFWEIVCCEGSACPCMFQLKPTDTFSQGLASFRKSSLSSLSATVLPDGCSPYYKSLNKIISVIVWCIFVFHKCRLISISQKALHGLTPSWSDFTLPPLLPLKPISHSSLTGYLNFAISITLSWVSLPLHELPQLGQDFLPMFSSQLVPTPPSRWNSFPLSLETFLNPFHNAWYFAVLHQSVHHTVFTTVCGRMVS